MLRLLNVHARRLEEAEKNVFDVFSNIARLGEGRGIGDGKRHVEHSSEGSRDQRFSGASGAEEQDVALLDLDIIELAHGGRCRVPEDAFVVVVNGNRDDPLGFGLANHVVVEKLFDFLRRRNFFARLRQLGGSGIV